MSESRDYFDSDPPLGLGVPVLLCVLFAFAVAGVAAGVKWLL